MRFDTITTTTNKLLNIIPDHLYNQGMILRLQASLYRCELYV